MRERCHKSLLIPVWIRGFGAPLFQCVMTSVSEHGGELQVHPNQVPDLFDLLFSPIAQSWRECSTIWCDRNANSVGICFLRRHVPLYQTRTAPRFPGGNPSLAE